MVILNILRSAELTSWKGIISWNGSDPSKLTAIETGKALLNTTLLKMIQKFYLFQEHMPSESQLLQLCGDFSKCQSMSQLPLLCDCPLNTSNPIHG